LEIASLLPLLKLVRQRAAMRREEGDLLVDGFLVESHTSLGDAGPY
jgi:hypothetical protein